jgi:enoyl-CoA hydratase/carnithine racemase
LQNIAAAAISQDKRMGHNIDDLDDAFRLELAMLQACFNQGDFRECVHTLTIYKDQSPDWNPPIIEQVDAENGKLYFKPD